MIYEKEFIKLTKSFINCIKNLLCVCVCVYVCVTAKPNLKIILMMEKVGRNR